MQRQWMIALIAAMSWIGCGGGSTGVDGGGDPDSGAPTDDGGIADGGLADGGPGTCADMPCDVNASCSDESGGPVCTCDDGFTGDGTSCTDVDECAATPNPCGAGTCTNEDGEYTCACPSGYTFNGTTCADDDECAASPCGVGTCTNGDGDYTCACPSGYTFNGTTCADDDECAASPCGVGTCTNGDGDYTCACPSGYTFDGTTCADDDECAASPCGVGTCTNGDGDYTCACPSGYAFDGTTCADVNECTAVPGLCGVGTCANGDGTYACACPAGYAFNGVTCVDVNECDATPPVCGVGSCTNGDGTYACTCPAGYTFDGVTCADVNECAATPPVCGVGTCTNGDGTYACACPAGYTFDGTTCADVNECAATPSPCATGATCTNSPGSYSCACPSGFEVSGGACVDIDECSRGTDTCGANTACLNASGSFTCECLSGFRPVTATTCAPARILVYSPGDPTVTDAATALGYEVITTTEGDWATRFDAGGFEAVIVSAPNDWPQTEMEARLPGYIAGGGRVLFAVWDLDASAPLKTAFGVTTADMFSPRSIHADGSRFDLWNQQSTLPSPIAPNAVDPWTDNGDELTLTGAGYVAARFDSAAGPNATVVTNGGRTIVDGFLFSDMTSADGDSDSVADAQELARNQINLLMNPRVLVHTGSGGGSTTVVPAVTRIGYTVRRTTTPAQFATSFDAGGFDLVMVDIASDGYDGAVESRLTSWVGGGGRLVLSYWDLDAASALATAVGVSTASFDSAPSVHATSPVRASFFNLVQSVPSPLTGVDEWDDNGDQLALTGAGFIAARFGSASTSPGATAVTRSDRVIVNGFLTDDLGTTDGDSDGIADVHELYENQLHFLFLE